MAALGLKNISTVSVVRYLQMSMKQSKAIIMFVHVPDSYILTLYSPHRPQLERNDSLSLADRKLRKND